MNQKLILIGVVALVILANVGIYIYNQPDRGYIDPRLENNTAAQEIADLGIDVVVEELGEDQNGYTVRGQATAVGDVENVVKVALDDDIYPSGYEAHAILYHELGHVVNKGTDDNEANADAYALNRGYEIHDAYSGIH